jgi:hypothetical protein
MSDDYLWDKTGQPDPEIQQLEEILGTMRYQPKPLEIPQDLVVPRRRSYFPLLAIAASLLLALLAGGIWLRLRSHGEVPPQQAKVETPKLDEKSPAPEPPRNKSAANPPSVVVVTHKHRNKSASSAEALAAKQQLMLALRVTTEKLSLVQKKTQIRNQHKVG